MKCLTNIQLNKKYRQDICSKCGLIGSIVRKDNTCKHCYDKEYREANKEEIKQYQKQYVKEHWDEHLENGRRWRNNHLEQVRASGREYASQHKEQHQLYEQTHRGERRLSSQKWRDNNREKCRVYQRKYYRTHTKAVQTDNKKRTSRARIQALIILVGTQHIICNKCGYDVDVRALQIDKITGGHRKWAKEKKLTNTLRFYYWIIKNPEFAIKEFQILCANCNYLKRHYNNEWGGNFSLKK